MISTNVDPNEIAKFTRLSAEWWDLQGPCQLLHGLNPLRLQFIQSHVNLRHKKILDVGCGGGILSEALAQAGGDITAIDLSMDTLAVAKQHAQQMSLQINYECIAVENLAAQMPAGFDVITCMELLEHVPDPASVIQACSTLLKPGGTVFFATINRTLKAYMRAIIGAEYLLRLLPRGTHDYAKFIRPNELAQWARAARLSTMAMQGVAYHPLTKQFSLTEDVAVNYLMCCIKDA